MRAQIRVLEFNMGSFDGKRRSVMLMQFLPDGSRPKARYILGFAARKPQHRAYAMRSVMHGRQSRPVVWPAVHILLVTGFEELDFAQLSLFVQFFHEQKLTGVY